MGVAESKSPGGFAATAPAAAPTIRVEALPCHADGAAPLRKRFVRIMLGYSQIAMHEQAERCC